MTKINDPWLTDPATQAVFSMLESSGAKAYAVGGCVRNALLG
jgi:poly(A) polymerase